MDYIEFLQTYTDEKCLQAFHDTNMGEGSSWGCALAQHCQSYPDKKDLLKEKIFHFLSDSISDNEEKTFALGEVAKIYPDTESILQIIAQTKGIDNSYNRLSSLYDNILALNSAPDVLDAMMEKIANIKTRGRCDDGFDNILRKVMEEQKDIKKIDLYLNQARDKGSIWGTIAKQFPSKEMLSKFLNKDESIPDSALVTLLSQLKTEDIEKSQSETIIERAVVSSVMQINLLEELIQKDSSEETIDKIIKRISKKPNDDYKKIAAFLKEDDDEEESPSDKTEINFSTLAPIFSLIISNVSDMKILKKMAEMKEDMYGVLPHSSFEQITRAFCEKDYISTSLAQKYPELTVAEALLAEANKVKKMQDPKQEAEFKNFLLSEGERSLYALDEQVMDYLTDNFTQENLDAVNTLRSNYGLKVVIDEAPMTDANLRTTRRMQFEGSISITEEGSDFYDVQYSQAYRDFVPDLSKKYKPRDYNDVFEKSQAIQILKNFGYDQFIKKLQGILPKAHIPPETALQFNVKDMQALIINNECDNRDVFDSDGDYVFTKTRFENLGGNSIDVAPAREKYWQEVVKNKELIERMSADLRNHGINGDDIQQLWDCAEKYGHPNHGRRRDKVRSVFLQLHHNEALMNGGENVPDNVVIVAFYPDNFSSHDPLHRKDNPLVKLYRNPYAKSPQDKMITTEPMCKNAQRVRIKTVFLADEENENSNIKTRFYGGARASSTYVGSLEGMTNTVELTLQLVEQKRQEEKKKIELEQKIKAIQETKNKLSQKKKQEQDSQKQEEQKYQEQYKKNAVQSKVSHTSSGYGKTARNNISGKRISRI